jgi:hypothetical protein
METKKPKSMKQGSPESFIWISGYEGLYKISNFGRVISVEKVVPCRNKFYIRRKERILKPAPSSRGYLSVRLSKKGLCKTYFIHHLVASHFIKNKNKNYNQINHKDGNKLNNHHSNLEWINQKLNQIHCYKLGLQKPKYFLTDNQFKEAKDLIRKGLKIKDVCKKFGVNRNYFNKRRKNGWSK